MNSLLLLQLNETPLHIAAKEGILPIVQTLCAFGCKLEILSRVCRKTKLSKKIYCYWGGKSRSYFIVLHYLKISICIAGRNDPFALSFKRRSPGGGSVLTSLWC